MPYADPLTIKELCPICPNGFEPLREGGRDFISVEVVQNKGKAAEARLHIRVRLNSFSQIAEEFAGSWWGVGNNYPSISAKRPDGQPDRFYVGRVLAYHAQQRDLLEGKRTQPPSTKGVYVAYARDNKYDLSAEDLPVRNARETQRRTHWATGWTILWRQRMLAERRPVTTQRPLKTPLHVGGPRIERLGVWKQPEHLDAAILEADAFKAALEALRLQWSGQ